MTQVAEEKAMVPELRFNQFSEVWGQLRFKDIGYFYYGKSAPKWSLSESAETPCVRYGELYTKFNGIVTQIYSYTDIPKDELKFSRGGEVLIPRVGEDPLDFSEASYLPLEGIAIGEMISVFNTKEHGEFITQYIRGKLKKKFARVVEGGNVSNLYFRYLEPIFIGLPSKEEQQKIASFLTAVDDKLNLLRRKRDGLQAYKRGVMQQLFSQTLRFKQNDGTDFPDWEERKLGEVSDVRDGTHESPSYQNEGFPLITSKNLMKSGCISFDDIEFISHDDYREINKRSKVDVGDILFGMIGTIGNPVQVKSSGFAIKNVALIKELEELNNCFLIHFLSSDYIKKQFHEQNTGGTQKFIALGVIRSLIVLIPDVNEQQKIANYLSAIDKKIAAVSQQITQTETFKQGLLQKMFV